MKIPIFCEKYFSILSMYVCHVKIINMRAIYVQWRRPLAQGRSQTFQNEGVARGAEGCTGGLTGTQNGSSP